MRKTYLAGILAAMLLLSSCGLTEGKTPQVLGPEDIGEIVDGSGGNTPSGENGQESMPASDRTTGDGMTEGQPADTGYRRRVGRWDRNTASCIRWGRKRIS